MHWNNPYTVICHIVAAFNSRFVCLIMHGEFWYSLAYKIVFRKLTESGRKKHYSKWKRERERDKNEWSNNENADRHAVHRMHIW